MINFLDRDKSMTDMLHNLQINIIEEIKETYPDINYGVTNTVHDVINYELSYN